MLAERTVLLIVAAFAYLAIARRRVAGRWLALGLAVFVCYRLSYSMWGAWRAGILADVNMTPPGVAYSTREEGAIALIRNIAVLCWLGFMIVQLALGSAVRKCFDTRQADAP